MKAYSVEAIEEDKEWLKNYQHLNPELGKWKTFVTSNIKMWFEDTAITQTQLKSINIPALIIQGDHDQVKLEHSMQIFQSLRKDSCVFIQMPDTTSHLSIPKYWQKLPLSFIITHETRRYNAFTKCGRQ